MTKKIENEIWAVEDLIPYAKNAKKHSDEQVAKLAKLIEQHGWSQPIFIVGDDLENNPRGTIIAGHGRRLAAIKLGREKVPVRVLYGGSKTDVDALRLADNRLSSQDYDRELELFEMASLADEGVDLLGLGYTDKEIDFSSLDLGAVDEMAFTDDITTAVEAQATANKSAAAAADDDATPIGEALGFKRISVAQSRLVRSWIAKIEHLTGKRGVDAFLAFIAEEKAA